MSIRQYKNNQGLLERENQSRICYNKILYRNDSFSLDIFQMKNPVEFYYTILELKIDI
jgi:hypothetical protein